MSRQGQAEEKEEESGRKRRRAPQGGRVRCPWCGAPLTVWDYDDPDRVIANHLNGCPKRHLHPQYQDAPPAPSIPPRRNHKRGER